MFTRGGELVLAGGKFPRLTSTEPLSKMREIFALARKPLTVNVHKAQVDHSHVVSVS